MLDQIKSYMDSFDWEGYMNRQDTVWDDLKYKEGFLKEDTDPRTVRLPKSWGDSGLTGNGMIGAAVYKKDKDTLIWELGRNDVEAKFLIPEVDTCFPRMSIGNVCLSASGNIQKETMRLGLYNAEVSGTIKTNKGGISWRSVSHALENVIVIEVSAEGGERDCHIRFNPGTGMTWKAWATPEMVVGE